MDCSKIKEPGAYDVVVAYSFVGDIISDVMAAVTGGVATAASCALSQDGIAVFEPIHGTAPRRASERPLRVNPTGAIRAAALLLEHLGRAEQANAIHRALSCGAWPRTPDQGGSATTAELTEALVSSLRQQADHPRSTG